MDKVSAFSSKVYVHELHACGDTHTFTHKHKQHTRTHNRAHMHTHTTSPHPLDLEVSILGRICTAWKTSLDPRGHLFQSSR